MLKITALVFLLLAGVALEATGARGSSGVPMQEINASEILAKIKEGQPVEYDHVVVRGDLDLSQNNLKKNINVPIWIEDSIFNDEVNCHNTTFEKSINMSGSNLTSVSYFGSSTFREDANFFRANFSKDARFVGSKFSAVTNFQEANFSSDADFSMASFSDDANLKDATFIRNAIFNDATFSRDTGFQEATFKKDAKFNGATFSGPVYFKGATFSGGCDLGEAAFGGDADFNDATFKDNAIFENAEFNENIEFGGARFENETSFYRILFKRPAYFENCSIESLNLTKAEYSRLHLRWDEIKSLHFDETAYLALIKNYNSLGWYGDANKCYYDYRNAVRENWMMASSTGFEPPEIKPILRRIDLFIDYMEWILYGYGVRPIIPISRSAIIILAFGLFFRQKRCLRKIIVEERIEESKDLSDEVLVKTTARRAEINALDPILFSLFTFTSGFTAFLHPAVEYK